MLVERAINYTWTSKMAREWGFKDVTPVELIGTPGHYSRVVVEYR